MEAGSIPEPKSSLIVSGHFLRSDRHGTSVISSKGINLIILGGELGLELRG